MEAKLKYASMCQYIDLWDTTLESHLQIGLKNFPFEERIEQPIPQKYQGGKA